MARAQHLCCGWTSPLGGLDLLGRPPADAPSSAQSIPREPVPDGRLAALDRLGYLRDRHVRLDQCLQLPPPEAAPCGRPLTMDRLKPVLPNPVPDRRFMQPKPLEQLLRQGLSLAEIAERFGLHESTVGYWVGKHGLEAVHRERVPDGVAARAKCGPHADDPHRLGRNSRTYVRPARAQARTPGRGAAHSTRGEIAALRLRGRTLLIPRAFQHAPVGAIERTLDSGSALGERAHVAALLPPRAHDLAVDARELELQALHLEHCRIGLLAPRLDHQLGEQSLELSIELGLDALARRAAGGSAMHRVAQVAR